MMRRTCAFVTCVILVLSLVVPAFGANVVETGSCGEAATYTLYGDGALVIEGSGEISNTAFRWRKDITSVKICDGITSIADFAFEGNHAITSIDLGNTLKSIGEGAFAECKLLKEIVIPDSVVSLNGNRPAGSSGLGAFYDCLAVEKVTIGKGVTLIPWGFMNSDKLQTLIIPDNVTVLDAYAFGFCPRLTYVEISKNIESIGTFAFVNNYSLTTVIFRGRAPERMDSAVYCASFNAAGFYPKDDPTWADADNMMAMANMMDAIPYTIDGNGAVIPELPETDELDTWLAHFKNVKYPAGTNYPDTYSYIINGNFLTAYGAEAFAYQLSDALYGHRPISEKRNVEFAELSIGDVLYFEDQVCVVTALQADSAQVAGVDADETVYYDRSLTKAYVETAKAYRTRCGVAPYPGETDSALDYELADLPTWLPTEKEVYDILISLKDTFPEAMPYTSKNHFFSKTESPTYTDENGTPMVLNNMGHGCSAFVNYASDLCFGNRKARYIVAKNMRYDDLRVGDALMANNHAVILLEVHPDHVVVAEGNYNEMIHWGRTITREEIEGKYDVYTRYPEFTDIGSREENRYYYEPVLWAVKNDITSGTSETTFEPESVCTRGQIVTFLWRTNGCPEPETAVNPFTDVSATEYYYKAVLWAVENKITLGASETTFDPNASCTRGQVATFLWRASNKPASTAQNPFTDVPATEYYYEPVIWAVENKITAGTSETTFDPDDPCTRGQIVTFLYRTFA